MTLATKAPSTSCWLPYWQGASITACVPCKWMSLMGSTWYRWWQSAAGKHDPERRPAGRPGGQTLSFKWAWIKDKIVHLLDCLNRLDAFTHANRTVAQSHSHFWCCSFYFVSRFNMQNQDGKTIEGSGGWRHSFIKTPTNTRSQDDEPVSHIFNINPDTGLVLLSRACATDRRSHFVYRD